MLCGITELVYFQVRTVEGDTQLPGTARGRTKWLLSFVGRPRLRAFCPMGRISWLHAAKQHSWSGPQRGRLMGRWCRPPALQSRQRPYSRKGHGWCSTWSRFSRPGLRGSREGRYRQGRDCQKVLQQRNERLLQSLAFHGMIMARSCSQAGVLLA